MVDIHCHLLPGIDDGAASWEVAVEMCRLAVEDGITHIVATPHANDRFAYNRDAHRATLEELRHRTGNSIELSLGCDFHFSYDNVQSLLTDRSPYTIGSTRYLLIELSDFSIPPQMRQTLAHLLEVGLHPILTHPERNALLQRSPGQVLEWADAGCIVQVTANSVTGFWGKKAQQIARWLLEHNAVHVIASDAHDTRHRPPLLSGARDMLREWAEADVVEALVNANPAAIVADQPLPYLPPPLL